MLGLQATVLLLSLVPKLCTSFKLCNGRDEPEMFWTAISAPLLLSLVLNLAHACRGWDCWAACGAATHF